jgi:enterochelin esterase-like enzyme
VSGGSFDETTVRSAALGRDCPVTLYRPARFRRGTVYPLLVVHDGGDYLHRAAMGALLDTLIERREVAELVAAFLHPGERLVEYADSRAHARFLTHELVPRLEADLPLVEAPRGRGLMGASFGAVASLAAAWRAPAVYGALILMSGSFVFTDVDGADVDGAGHGEDPVFDPVVAFVNRYRRAPRRVADRLFVTCGSTEDLIDVNRVMVPVFRSTGMTVDFTEIPAGHGWDNWSAALPAALRWFAPGH